MKKIRSTLSLLLTAAILLSCTACGGGESTLSSENISESSAESTSDATENTSAPEQEGSSSESVQESKPVSKQLGEYTLDEIRSFTPVIMEDDRNAIFDQNISDMTNTWNMIRGNTIYFDTEYFEIGVRESTRALRTQLDGENGIKGLMAESKYISHQNFADGYTAYDISWAEPQLSFGVSESETEPKVSTFIQNYSISDTITTRAFIRQQKGFNHADIILDPAYTYGIPMLSSLADNMTFDINGRTIYADTLSFRGELYSEAPDIPEDYVYAEITFSGMRVIYTASDEEWRRGYDNKLDLIEVKILTEDTDAIIDSGYIMSDVEKDPRMTEVYTAIIDNLSTIYNENTSGIVLIDMDFDGMPEVLTSELKTFDESGEETYAHQWGAEVDIYRIKDGSLKFIDTINNAHMVGTSVSNILGLKELPDGSKAWFVIDWNGTDYLYTLEGDTLKKTEVFGIGEEFTITNGKYSETSMYYHMGEKMMAEIVENDDYDPDEPYAFEYYLRWNDITANFGAWELFGFARQEYCKDIETTFFLYSDWLCNFKPGYSDIYKKEDIQRYTLTVRELTFNIANMVDEFFLGEYNSAKHKYSYRFLGDYAKPVIYLYPEEKTEVSVKVDFVGEGEITVSYPEYGSGWNVTAMPDGTLYDADGNEYYCLYWEGSGKAALDMSKGFCVSGKDTAAFLREKLMGIGLTAREANEFIIYWLPLMQGNEYNIISLHTEEYSAAVPMTVSPAPDSVIRVFMTYAPSDKYVDIPAQQLPSYERSGFTVVEWGGGLAE